VEIDPARVHLATHRLLFHELVAHGRNSGENEAESFSNEDGSLMSSLGALFLTGAVSTGRNGYSLRPRGLELQSARMNVTLIDTR